MVKKKDKDLLVAFPVPTQKGLIPFQISFLKEIKFLWQTLTTRDSEANLNKLLLAKTEQSEHQ